MLLCVKIIRIWIGFNNVNVPMFYSPTYCCDLSCQGIYYRLCIYRHQRRFMSVLAVHIVAVMHVLSTATI